MFTRKMVKNPMTIPMRQKRSFLTVCAAQPQINPLAMTKTLGKSFAVLAGFCPE